MPTIRAVRIREAGGPEVLELVARELRDAGPGELLVRVRAAGLNRADVMQRRGLYPAPPGVVKDVPGLEYAGAVAAGGAGVERWPPGDRVLGGGAGGARASHLIVHEREAIAMPAGMDFHRAAAIPEAFLTAWDALDQAELRMGERVLIHAVASGVGTAALQLVRAAGASAIGTSRTAEKLERCQRLGLEAGVLVQEGRFAEATGPVDVILDLIGASYGAENARAVALRGRWVVIGLVGGARAELPLGTLLARRARLIGTVLRARPLEEKAALAQRFAHQVLPLFESGQLAPVVDEVLPLEEVASAHERLERNVTFGKLVLTT